MTTMPVEMKEKNWIEVKYYLEKRKDIILPIGTTEEHGYHLPLFTDSIEAEALAFEISRRIGIMVAPAVPYSVCQEITGTYVGTISVSPAGLGVYVQDILTGLKKNGFVTVFILLTHDEKENIEKLREVARQVRDKEFKVVVLNPWDFDFDVSKIIGTEMYHACEGETSLMLYISDKKVKMEKAKNGEIHKDFRGIPIPTESGSFGYPTLASKEKGGVLFEKIVNMLIKRISEHG